MNKLKRRRPGYFTGFEDTEHEFNTLEEMLEIDWIDGFTKQHNFHQFSIGDKSNIGKPALMAELNEGESWWVIGWLDHAVEGLPKWEPPVGI